MACQGVNHTCVAQPSHDRDYKYDHIPALSAIELGLIHPAINLLRIATNVQLKSREKIVGAHLGTYFLASTTLLVNRWTQDRILNVQYEWTTHHCHVLQPGQKPAAINAPVTGTRTALME